MKRIFFNSQFLFFCLCIKISSFAQVVVNTDVSRVALVQKLEGEGVKIFNISVFCNGKKEGAPFGEILDPVGVLGIDEGIILTTGSAKGIVGPNDKSSFGVDNQIDFIDNDLAALSPNNELYDGCRMEFDIVAATKELKFNYVFGSEEYPEFTGNNGGQLFNDVFGFFITKESTGRKENLAVLPGTKIPITVGNINDKQNKQYYVANGSGATPQYNLFVQYDGYTKLMEASVEIEPCEIYHMKIAIADAVDGIYDSGVIIKQGSFRSLAPPAMNLSYENSNFSYGVEGCNDAIVTIKRTDHFREALAEGIRLKLEVLSSNASEGEDFPVINKDVFIPPFVDSIQIQIPFFEDNIDDDNEEFLLTLIDEDCESFTIVNSVTIPIRDSISYPLEDVSVCKDSILLINPDAKENDSLIWEHLDNLSCQNCPSPFLDLTEDSQRVAYTYIDKISGCTTQDTFYVKKNLMVVDFETVKDPNYSSSDGVFENLSTGTENYFWDFGDGQNSTEFSPAHFYETESIAEKKIFVVSLKGRLENPACELVVTDTFEITKPLFVPNLITLNQDNRNDFWFIRGIEPGFWKVKIYNRWGEEVYQSDNYMLDWQPYELSSGLYFYFLQNAYGDRNYNGWIQVFNNK